MTEVLKTSNIHPTALVAESAILGVGVTIEPFVIIEDDVVIGDYTTVGAYTKICSGVHIGKKNTIYTSVLICGDTVIGDENEIFKGATIGEINQDLKYKNEPTKTVIGNRNKIREMVTIHRGTIQGTGVTKIGDDNLLMIGMHVAHDCNIGNKCVLANGVTLAGHITIGNYVTIGGLSAIHQFTVIGSHVMLGGGSMVNKDVPPYVLAQGNHAVSFGLNREGLKRRDFTAEDLSIIKSAYEIVFTKTLSRKEQMEKLTKLAENDPRQRVQLFLDFLELSTRGIVKTNKEDKH